MPARTHAVRIALGATLGAVLTGVYMQHADRQAAEPPAAQPRAPLIAQSPYQAQRGTERNATEPGRRAITDASAGIAVLTGALTSDDSNVRVDAIAELGASPDRQAEDLLAHAAVNDVDPAVRAEALHALAFIHADTQDHVFRHALTDADRDVREAAVAALEDIGNESSVQTLALALDDADPSLRAMAADALGEIGSEAADDLLLRALTDQSSVVREVAVTRLAQRSEPPP